MLNLMLGCDLCGDGALTCVECADLIQRCKSPIRVIFNPEKSVYRAVYESFPNLRGEHRQWTNAITAAHRAYIASCKKVLNDAARVH